MTPRKSKKQPRKIAIWGYAEESRDLVYDLDESWEIWGINMAHAFMNPRLRARPTNWFQLHPASWNGSGKGATGFWGRPKEHLEFLEKFEGTVWMQYPDEPIASTIPNRQAYPLNEIILAAGRDYLTSTFSYQFALAWYQHVYEKNPVSDIHVYGVNLSATEEYSHQRPAAEYWIGRLEQAGVKVYAPPASSLLKGKPYARGGADSDELSSHAMERLAHWRERLHTASSDALVAQSCKGEIGHWARFISAIFTSDEVRAEMPAELEEKLRNTFEAEFNKRTQNMTKLEQKSFADMNAAIAMVKDNFHWLTVTGGFDHRANNIPEYRSPSSAIFQDWEMPDARAI